MDYTSVSTWLNFQPRYQADQSLGPIAQGNEYGYPPTPPSSQPSPAWNAHAFPPHPTSIPAATPVPLPRTPPGLVHPSLAIGRPPSPGLQQRALTAPSTDPRLAGLVRGGARTPVRRSTSPGLGGPSTRLALTQGGEVGVARPVVMKARLQTGLPGRRLSAGAGGAGGAGRPMLKAYSSSPPEGGMALVPAGGGGGAGRATLNRGWN